MTTERQETIDDIANVADNRSIRQCAITEYDEKLAKGYGDERAYGFAMDLIRIMNTNNRRDDSLEDGY